MNELRDLKSSLIDELKEYSRKEITSGNLEIIDKLAHAVKNLCKVIDDDDGYSGSYPDRREHSRMYSRSGLSDRLRELMNDAPDDRTRSEIKRLIDRM